MGVTRRLDTLDSFPRRELVPAGWEPTAANGTAAWYLTDRQGSVRDLTNASGAVQDHVSYDGFGNVVSESNASIGDRYKYTGRELDGHIQNVIQNIAKVQFFILFLIIFILTFIPSGAFALNLNIHMNKKNLKIKK